MYVGLGAVLTCKPWVWTRTLRSGPRSQVCKFFGVLVILGLSDLGFGVSLYISYAIIGSALSKIWLGDTAVLQAELICMERSQVRE